MFSRTEFLVDRFSRSQFLVDGFSRTQFIVDGSSELIRLDKNKKGGGIMVFVGQDIPSSLLQKHVLLVSIENLFNKLYVRKCKWLLFGTYHPPSQEDQYCYGSLDEALYTYCQHDNISLNLILILKLQRSA